MSGLLYGGGLDQLWRQAVGAVAVMAFSFGIAWLLGLLVDKTVGFRVTEEGEVEGVDQAVHAETAYDLLANGAGSYRPHVVHATTSNSTTVRF